MVSIDKQLQVLTQMVIRKSFEIARAREQEDPEQVAMLTEQLMDIEGIRDTVAQVKAIKEFFTQ